MKSEIERVVQWLQSKDETHWAEQIDLLEEVLWDLRRDNMRAAIPHVERMLSEMWSRNRTAAITSGGAAVAALR
jgi:hypothetical protein